jgi:hypothetical protein
MIFMVFKIILFFVSQFYRGYNMNSIFKLCLSISIFLCCALFPAISIYGQPPPCGDLCSNEWTYSYLPAVGNAGSCNFLIDYRYRKCGTNDMYKEIEILEIHDLSGCGLTPISDIMNGAIRQMLFESQWLFEIPDPGVNSWNVWVQARPCWKLNGNEIVPSCTTYTCCIYRYNIIFDETGVICQEVEEVQSYESNCPSPPTFCYGVNVCSAFSSGIGDDQPVLPGSEFCMGEDDDIPWSNIPSSRYGYLSRNGGYPGDCQFRIFYFERIVSENGWSIKEFLIYKVEILGDCSPSLSISAILDRATEIVLANYAQEDVMDYNTVHKYRRKIPACWKQVNNILIPCTYNDNYCCRWLYYVQRTGLFTWVWTVASMESSLSTDICEALSCTFYCSQGVNPDGYLKPKESNSESLILDKNILTTSFVKPIPVQDKVDIHFISGSLGESEIRIFDMIGNEISKFVQNKKSSEIIFTIDMSGLADGLYFYKISIGDYLISNGKFVLSH